MRPRPFQQVDVFTATPYRGNPVAVVLDGSGLSPDEMQRFTNWTNLSEATFVLPPTDPRADYRVRIFCPGRELAFAGHPTLGTCHAWLAAGGQPRGEKIVQQCGVGLVDIERDGEQLSFAAPPLIKSGPLAEADLELIARGLHLERGDIVAHAWCDNGPNWRGVLLRSAEQVLALRPDPRVLADYDLGVIGAFAAGSDTAFEVRAFFPGNAGLTEDPVTGSLNAAFGQWLIGAGLAPERYVASQGTALDRQGRVHVKRDAQGQVWVGGQCAVCVRGEVVL